MDLEPLDNNHLVIFQDTDKMINTNHNNIQIGNDGQAANAKVELYMSAESKTALQQEFPKFGATDWQSFLGTLINHRQQLLAHNVSNHPSSFPNQTVPPPSKKSNTKNWIIGILILLLLIIILWLFKTKSLPKITFQT